MPNGVGKRLGDNEDDRWRFAGSGKVSGTESQGVDWVSRSRFSWRVQSLIRFLHQTLNIVFDSALTHLLFWRSPAFLFCGSILY